jgi:hypothetical protein
MPVVAVNTDGVFTAGRKSGANMFDLEGWKSYGPSKHHLLPATLRRNSECRHRQPKIDQYDMSGKVEFGNYRNMQTEGMLNVPIGNRLL